MTKREQAELIVESGGCNMPGGYTLCQECKLKKECGEYVDKYRQTDASTVSVEVAKQYLKETHGWEEFLLTGDEWEWERKEIPNGVYIKYRPKPAPKAPSQEDLTKAFKDLAHYWPCDHESVDKTLGDGKTWCKCENCGDTIKQDRLEISRESAKRFSDAMDLLKSVVFPPEGRDE